jgi:hypothetical protein
MKVNIDGMKNVARWGGGGLTVSRMSVDSLEKTECDPYVNGDDVEVWFEPAPE